MGLVELQITSGVARIALNSPGKRNALSLEMAQQLADACDEINGDRTIGVAIIRGADGYFCSGVERSALNHSSRDPSEAQNFEATNTVYNAFARVDDLQVPTIAAVRGGAVGAGMNLLLAADLRLVAANATLKSGFAAARITPGGGHLSLLGRLTGREGAAALGVFGLEISGDRAVEIGLAWESPADNAVDDRATEIAEPLATDPDLSRAVAGLLRAELGPPVVTWAAALRAEQGTQMWALRRRAMTPSEWRTPGPERAEQMPGQ